MKHVIQHHLDVAQSRRVAERALEHYTTRFAKYEPRVRWVDDKRAEVTFSAKGMTVRGTVELQPGAVAVDLEVPFLFRAFRGTAIRILEAEIKKLLAEHAPQAQAGQAAPRSA